MSSNPTSDVFPFPPTPKFTGLTQVSTYLQTCGFNVTWQSFHRTYLKFLENNRASINQMMRSYGVPIECNGNSNHDKLSMLILRDMLDVDLRNIMMQALQQRGKAHREQFTFELARMVNKADDIPGVSKMYRAMSHIHGVLNAVIDSIDRHHGGETNQHYLNHLYRLAMRHAGACCGIDQAPGEFFKVLLTQHETNVAEIIPQGAASYGMMFGELAAMCDAVEEDDIESPDQHLQERLESIRWHMKAIMKDIGCPAEEEKAIYKKCNKAIESLDTVEQIKQTCTAIADEHMREIADRSVQDATAHAAVIDFNIADFICDIMKVRRSLFEVRRFAFASALVDGYFKDQDVPQSASDDFADESGTI